ncbi:HNH endonuclease signature motif containing protein [Pseudomonas lundensis]|uniref:HNH endonuclease signature motif containing protein n=1 Tax=Pseudomonas lundensis TaxID=86185 RepID=UPI0034668E5E
MRPRNRRITSSSVRSTRTLTTSQFNATNQGWLAKGNSPFAPKAERNGGNGRYEIHHIEHIQHGGAIYDIDNLCVATPKRHVEIHKEGRQAS